MFALLLVVACGGAGSDVVTSAAAEDAARAATAEGCDGLAVRPFKGRCETAFTMETTTTEAGIPIRFDIEITGTCQFTHLGRTAVVAQQVVLLQPPPAQQVVTNTAVLTAANGDTLLSSFSGLGDQTGPLQVTFTGDDAYRGGTGRFGDATGLATLTGGALFDPPPPGEPFPLGGTGFYEVSGTICY